MARAGREHGLSNCLSAGGRLLAACAAMGLSICACNDDGTEQVAGKTVLRAWAHAGREAERRTLRDQVARFNAGDRGIHIELTTLPEGSYNSQVQASALAEDLPDLLEFDGPFVYNYAWQGKLIPLGELLDRKTRDNLISSIVEQGTYRDRFYSVGAYDSGLALFGRRNMLDKIQARIPKSPEDAWTVDEFERILARLADHDPDGQVLDLKLNYRGEWFTYAFSPILWSAGGGLVSREETPSAQGVLNGPESVSAMRRLQDWIDTRGYVDPNVDDNAFLGGRVALSWVGHWEYGRYVRAFGDDLALIPLPDFGIGSRTGQGSWNWGVTTRCEHPESAARFLEFLLEDRQVLDMTDANDAVPATGTAIDKSERYGKRGPLHLYVTQLTEDFSVPRPRTPAYPVITSVFQQAFADIRHGADVQTVLDRAAREIDRDIEDNQGYPARTARAGSP